MRVCALLLASLPLLLAACPGAGRRATGGGHPATPRPGLPRAAILELRMESLPATLAEQLRERIFRRLVSTGRYRRVISEANTAARIRELGLMRGCTVGPCLSRIGEQLGVERVVTGGVVAVGSSYDVLLSLLETGRGSLLGQFCARCDVCTYQELEAMIVRAADEIERQAR